MAPAYPLKRFVLIFGGYLVVGNLVLLLPQAKAWLIMPWTAMNARAAAFLASLGGTEFTASGSLLSLGMGFIVVKPGCNGVHALLLCLSAIMAYPTTWSARAMGGALATVLVFVMNLFRLVTLLWVGKDFPAQMEIVHLYVWQPLIATMAFGIFFLWGKYLASRSTQQELQ
jgi:exosortase/archaeosortase family protein